MSAAKRRRARLIARMVRMADQWERNMQADGMCWRKNAPLQMAMFACARTLRRRGLFDTFMATRRAA
jgi:hypothetical protein